MANEQELNLLLTAIAERVDLNRCRDADERYRRALTYEEVDLATYLELLDLIRSIPFDERA